MVYWAPEMYAAGHDLVESKGVLPLRHSPEILFDWLVEGREHVSLPENKCQVFLNTDLHTFMSSICDSLGDVLKQ